MRIRVWISIIHVKPDVIAHICNISAPLAEWEVETGESSETRGPASIMYREANKRPFLKCYRRQALITKVASELYIHCSVCACMEM